LAISEGVEPFLPCAHWARALAARLKLVPLIGIEPILNRF
jgi:hypothetical protein